MAQEHHRMIERRTDHERRKWVSEMSPEEMRQALLVSEKTEMKSQWRLCLTEFGIK
jgi:hypothetical protein